MNEPIDSVYLHLPFCLSRCRYCDFCSSILCEPLAEQVVSAELAELSRHDCLLARPVKTLFFGGGTPTALPDRLLQRLFETVADYIDPKTEWTVESNPATLTPPTLELLIEAGVNRLSIGVQSFQAEELAWLGRAHTPAQAERAVHRARQMGLKNLSIDLIYGLGCQNIASWAKTLQTALTLPITHISCYCLSVEPDTALAADVEAGRDRVMDEAVQRECYELAIDRLAEAGFEHYEISNFARPGFLCRHNLTYWDNRPYLGLGPSAVSYTNGVRRKNTPDLSAYVLASDQGREPTVESETLQGRSVAIETMMLNLRLMRGVDRTKFRARFGFDPAEQATQAVTRLVEQGFMQIPDQTLKLARKGCFVSDAVIAEIMSALRGQ